MAWHKPDHHSQGGQHGHKVGGGRVAVFWRRVGGKQTYSHAQRHQPKHPFTQRITQGGTHQQHHGTFKLAESIGSFAAVKDPQRDQVQCVKPCTRARQCGPESITGLEPKQSTDSRGKPSGERTSQADGCACPQRDTHSVPTHISAKTRNEHWHVCGQASALNVNEVSHLMDQDQDSESDPKCCSPQLPIETQKSHKAEQEFEFPQRQQNRPYWSQTLGPIRCCIRTTLATSLGGCGGLQLANMATNPFRLRG